MKYFYIFIFTPLTLFAQISSGKVSYKLVFNDDVNLQKSDIGSLYSLAKEQSEHMFYNLDFNSIESTFSSKQVIMKEDVNYADIFSEASGIYYRKQADTLVYNALNDDNFGKIIIKYKDTINWELTNETKMIDEFICYKALSSYRIDNGKKIYTNKVVAWYCPTLPFQYGPRGFGGLPGLIFELQDQRVNFVLVSIKQVDNLKIEKPAAERIVSLKEYNQLLMNMNNDR
jgi:GLPGLI family protein